MPSLASTRPIEGTSENAELGTPRNSIVWVSQSGFDKNSASPARRLSSMAWYRPNDKGNRPADEMRTGKSRHVLPAGPVDRRAGRHGAIQADPHHGSCARVQEPQRDHAEYDSRRDSESERDAGRLIPGTRIRGTGAPIRGLLLRREKLLARSSSNASGARLRC